MLKSNLFDRRVAAAVFTTLLIASGFALVIFYLDFFLLVFAGIFFAVLLNAFANWIYRKTKLRYSFSLVLVMLLIVGFFTAIVLLIGPSISQQVNEMVETLPKSLQSLQEKVKQTEIGRSIFDEVPEKPQDMIKDKKDILYRVTGIFTSTIGVFADILIILITGLFLASDPRTYTKGFIRLFPVTFRNRLSDVLDQTHRTLTLWMVAKLLSMAVVGICTGIGLQLLGIPLPYALALIAALLSFIPNIGPYLALAPALLIAFMSGPQDALYVLILYFAIQIVESYVVTPLIEKKIVAIPPALMLMWMVLFGIFAGILGLILATPILAAIIIIVKELYVKDYLEENRQIQNLDNASDKLEKI